MKVGIPKGLFYHYYYPLWKTFFQDLGAQVITSSATNRLTVVMGIESAVDEACFPIKVYYGHVRELCQRELDYIFIPRMVSVEPKSYICPKFMGLPDMIKANIRDLPPVIGITVDVSENDRILQRDIIRVGKIFTNNKNHIKQAYEHGKYELRKCRKLCGENYNISEAIQLWEGQQLDIPYQYDLNIGVLGHGYSLYDQTISMNLINRLRKMGCRVHVVENLDQVRIEKKSS